MARGPLPASSMSVVNKVDDHLAGLVASDRSRLKELNKKLQIVSQNTDSHLANVEVFLFTARGIHSIARKERATRVKGRGGKMRQRKIDKLEYVIASMEKQRKWFQNYKGQKYSSMQLVFNLVTQQDALNNIELAADMKKDSTSMNAIAALTMVFLPGTFTAVSPTLPSLCVPKTCLADSAIVCAQRWHLPI